MSETIKSKKNKCSRLLPCDGSLIWFSFLIFGWLIFSGNLMELYVWFLDEVPGADVLFGSSSQLKEMQWPLWMEWIGLGIGWVCLFIGIRLFMRLFDDYAT